ncbi:DUF742 domain-containing protein [Streptomyces hesseae]|uniref:DUF742 domain-containing protein n=1 Tax=Streptomyces hesseae TaxID=3075519 RepID=A0ABU2SRG0_9ACTN|nr:DUF742 domain-containing protein [Streptomyces sp. DSM 40473]MDT0450934.1 DUF742 domain-containing protein [Streptomyces sp. DSM 40473]
MSTAAPVLRAPAGPVPDRRTARVRPYSLTGGRGRCGHVLLMETFVGALADADDGRGDACGPGAPAGPGGALTSWLLPEVRAVLGLCRRLRSVAEVSALLRMPLGVVRVLLGDLADQGRIRVYGTGHLTGRPDRALLERVLSGLRRL